MTAEFNITIPGAEIIKRLADLETQVSTLVAAQPRLDAQEQRLAELAMTYAPVTYVDKHLEVLSRHFDYRLREEVAVLKDLIEGNIVPSRAAVSETEKPRPHDLASASRVERIAEDLAILRRELNLAIANGGEEIKQVNDRLDRHESLIANLIERVDRLTDFVNGKTAHAPNYPANDPEPPVDTSWHPYDVDVGYTWGEPPTGNKRVMVMQRTATAISGPFPASSIYWGEQGEFTIVAWRYAKEGE